MFHVKLRVRLADVSRETFFYYFHSTMFWFYGLEILSIGWPLSSML
jgi:hypothetical protein